MLFLALETSCDETAAAVFEAEAADLGQGPRIRSSVVAGQLELHARFGGVVPEVAARAHLRQLLPVVHEALRQAGAELRQIQAVAVMNTPGLVGALLVGVSAAKALALALDVPLFAVNHVEAHLYACRLAAGKEIFPCVGLVVSGGHTALFDCSSALRFQQIGGTLDDAAGEAFDKVAAMLGIGFPGGPAVERTARQGNPKAFAFPRSFWKEPRLDFSFSGLKTAVRYCLRDLPTTGNILDEQVKADVAASFQQAVVDVLAAKCRQALERTGYRRLAVGGGVAANLMLRQAFQQMCRKDDVELVIPPLAWCTDNAAMAALAVEKWRAGQAAGLDLDAEAVLQLPEPR
jgi:N6-L-threonylcarbamoyladenine synthase